MDILRKALFPYGMKRHEDGTWTFFNRDYKPAGLNTKDHIDYDPIYRFKLKGLGLATLKRLDVKGDGSSDTIFFYDDGCIPDKSAANLKAYFAKLSILIGLTG